MKRRILCSFAIVSIVIGMSGCSAQPSNSPVPESTSAATTKVPDSFTPQNCAILLVDHQKLTIDWVKSMPKEMVIGNVRVLARLGAEMMIPLVITTTMETTVVGNTIKDIQDLAPKQYAARIKRGGVLNCFLDTAFKNAVKATGRKNLIIAGLTTDICLMHTVEGALREGYTVQVVADACGSMTALADQVTFDRLRALGVTVTDGNQVLTELYTDFGTPDGQKASKINFDEIVSKLK